MARKPFTLIEVHLHDGFNFRIPAIDDRTGTDTALGATDDADPDDADDAASSDDSSSSRRGSRLLKTGTLVGILFLARKLKGRKADIGSLTDKLVGGDFAVDGLDDLDTDDVADAVDIEIEDDEDGSAGRGKGSLLFALVLLAGVAFAARKLMGGSDDELDDLAELDDFNDVDNDVNA